MSMYVARLQFGRPRRQHRDEADLAVQVFFSCPSPCPCPCPKGEAVQRFDHEKLDVTWLKGLESSQKTRRHGSIALRSAARRNRQRSSTCVVVSSWSPTLPTRLGETSRILSMLVAMV